MLMYRTVPHPLLPHPTIPELSALRLAIVIAKTAWQGCPSSFQGPGQLKKFLILESRQM